MTASSPSQSIDHLAQICRERSERGVATRADWERLAEIEPNRAYFELRAYLRLHNDDAQPNPYEKSTGFRPRGMALGFVVGVVVMAAYWLFADWLQANVVTTARQWDVVTLTQYIAASLLPAFAYWGWRVDKNRNEEQDRSTSNTASLKRATWDELLAQFDATRKAGGTRMY